MVTELVTRLDAELVSQTWDGLPHIRTLLDATNDIESLVNAGDPKLTSLAKSTLESLSSLARAL